MLTNLFDMNFVCGSMNVHNGDSKKSWFDKKNVYYTILFQRFSPEPQIETCTL